MTDGEHTSGTDGRTTTRRRLLRAAGTAAAAVGTGAVGGTATAIPTPRLGVEGRWLTDPTGDRVRLRGVATADPGFYARSWHPEEAVEVVERATDASAGWHPDHVRIPCTRSSVTHHGGVDAFVEKILRPTVDRLATRGVYALVDLHLIRPYTVAATETYNEENDADHAPPDEVVTTFWERVAPEFAEDDHVLYELFNEPTTPAHWGDDEAAWSAWREAAQPWVDLVRDHAPATPLVVGSPRWTSVPNVAPEEPFDGDHLIYAGHVYPANGYPEEEGPDGEGPFDPTYGAPAEEVPIWITEFGWDPDGGSVDRGTSSGFGRRFREWVESYGNVSWSAWCFDDSWAPTFFDSPGQGAGEPWTLKTDGDQAGGFIKRWLAETRGSSAPESPTEDSRAPPAPEPVAVTESTEIGATVAWSAVADDGPTGLSYYRVAVDGEPVERVVAGETTTTLSGLAPDSDYEVSVTAVDETDNESAPATATVETLTRSAGQSAYADHELPGRIQAEAFDVGGQGVAYRDESPGDEAGGGDRETTVDLGTAGAEGANVGYVAPGEWLEYTVTVPTGGEYEVAVSTAAAGAAGGTVAVEVDGRRVAERDLWPTGGWSSWRTIPVGTATLSPGRHVLRVVIVSGSFNLDWIEFEGPIGSGSVPAAPAGPSVRSRTASSVTVGWDGTGADRYAVRVDDRETTVPGDTTTATVAGLDPGAEYEIAVVALSGGTASPAATTTARTAADVAPIDGAEPTDPDGDGHYEDLNGSGDVDYDDVVTYFRRMDEPILTRHVGAYDYDGNGRIDYTDLVDLFEDVD